MIASRRVDCRRAWSGSWPRPAPGSGRRPRGDWPTRASSGSAPTSSASRPDPLGEREPVHLRHHGVQQHQGERLARRACLLQRGQRLAAALDRPSASCPSWRASPRGCGGWWRCRPRPGRAGRGPSAAPPGVGRAAGPGARPKRQREVERAAPADLALEPDLPAHHLDQAGRDRQAQPGAAVLAGRRGVGLGERLEEPLLLLGGDADAGVADGEVQAHLLARSATPPRRGAPPRPAR